MRRLTVFALIFFLLPSFALTPEDIYRKVKDSVYTVYAIKNSNTAQAYGSAVAVSDNTLATNCHVALQGNQVYVRDYDKSFAAKIIYHNIEQDLCLLQISGGLLKPVALRSVRTARIGEDVYAIGNPRAKEKSLSRGIISNLNEEKTGTWLQTDAAINFGSSGGGLFDANGNLLGITTKMSGNFSFALPSDWIIKLLHSGLKTVPEEQKSVEQYQNAYSGLSEIGRYGLDNVSVYRNNKQCFILIIGRDERNSDHSLFMWDPAQPQTAIVFPTATEARYAMILMYQMMQDAKQNPLKTEKTASYLQFGDNAYPIYSMSSGNKTYPFYSLPLPNNIQTVLLGLPSFKANFKTDDPRVGQFEASFGLRGFDYAYQVYQRDCRS